MARLEMGRVLVAGAGVGGHVVSALEAEGFAVTVREVSGLVEHCAGDRPDVVVLEVCSERSVVSLCTVLRERSEVPILLVGRGSIEGELIAGLKAGADSFVTAPVRERELVARIRALLRRAPVRPDVQQVVSIAGVCLDRMARRVSVAGQPMALTPREFEILDTLMREYGQVVVRSALTRTRWVGGAELRSLDVQVRRLRAKLAGVDGGRRIVAVRGVGYSFVDPATEGTGAADPGDDWSPIEIDLRRDRPEIVLEADVAYEGAGSRPKLSWA